MLPGERLENQVSAAEPLCGGLDTVATEFSDLFYTRCLTSLWVTPRDSV